VVSRALEEDLAVESISDTFSVSAEIRSVLGADNSWCTSFNRIVLSVKRKRLAGSVRAFERSNKWATLEGLALSTDSLASSIGACDSIADELLALVLGSSTSSIRAEDLVAGALADLGTFALLEGTRSISALDRMSQVALVGERGVQERSALIVGFSTVSGLRALDGSAVRATLDVGASLIGDHASSTLASMRSVRRASGLVEVGTSGLHGSA
jgi:hypothetical protein